MSSESTSKRIIRIDASSLSNSHCFLKFYRGAVQGYTTGKTENKMHFGSAFHVFIEKLALTESAPLAIGAAVKFYQSVPKEDLAIGEKDYLNEAYLVQLCLRYVEQFGETDKDRDFQFIRKPDGKPMVEQNFSVPFFEDDHCLILVQGTIDELGKFRNGGCVAFGDFKTTGSWAIDNYLSEHEMKNQLILYYWALKKLAEKAPDSEYARILKGRIGGFITGVFLKSDSTKIEVKRSRIFYFDDEKVTEFEGMLRSICHRITSTSRFEDVPIPREGILHNTCSGNFGSCMFIPVCKAPDRKTGEVILKNNFSLRDYKPLSFRKEDVKC